MRAKSLQSCLTFCDPMDGSLPVHRILQAGILEWIAISFFRGLPKPRTEPASLMSHALADRFFTLASLGKHSGPSLVVALGLSWASLVAQFVKNPPSMRETWVRSLGWEDPL